LKTLLIRSISGRVNKTLVPDTVCPVPHVVFGDHLYCWNLMPKNIGFFLHMMLMLMVLCYKF